MAYLPPAINASGIVIPTYQDALDYLVNNAKTIYGEDIYLGEDSQDYQFLSAFALLFYDTCQCLVADYYSHSVTTATGASLDRIAAYSGVTRNEGSPSVALLKCSGIPGTVVTYATVRDINGNLWQLEKEFVIGNLGYVEVYAECQKSGEIQAPIGSINQILNPTAGWESVTNEAAATIGTSVESDEHLRARLAYSASKSAVSILQSIQSEMEAISGVLRVKLYENFTEDYMDVIPPHSLALVIEGGDLQEIAHKLYNKKTPGTGLYGSEAVSIESLSGQDITVKFSRPTYKNTTIQVVITHLDNFTGNVVDEIKQNIKNTVSELQIGQVLYASNLYYSILSTITDLKAPTFFVNSVKVNNNLAVTPTLFELITTDISLINVQIL